ncbi:putative E3 ubiquitin-protein ligase SINA-like 6 [Solanum dulcamara]|uniref:putative E3 ubiquitin-protein ligase SINA-like 6 n=1 Tax=Solanum dulcamara TaxID=45834 RepID=UPI0024851417|nr:putative E3 ubiquitin-protein ligase SINA-like 6 [Solanum dulcamara]
MTMIRVNHSEEEEEAAEMARFSLGREEDDNDEGPSSPTRRPVPKRRRTTAGTFSCSAVRREQEQEQERERERHGGIEERVVEEEHEEEAEVEEEEDEEEEEDGDWESESESESEGNFRLSGDRRVRIRDSEVSRGNRSISAEDPDQNLEGSRGNGSISVTLSDPDVLDCPICLEHLCVPVFQCENGHIACASCCIKIANKCPSCCWPIGYNRCRAMEKVLESVKVSCVNKRYGCKEILSYSKKTDHENACIYVPCSCPSPACDFIGTSTKVYAHFSHAHFSSAQHIFFNAVHPIYIEKDQCCQVLQMRTEGILFIINHASDRVGSAINIICVGPAMQKRRFAYELVLTDGESSFKLESVAESVPNWSENIPLKKFLLVPRDVVNARARLKLDVFIEEKEYICNGCRC